MVQRTEKGVCGICPAGCGVKVGFNDDRIVEIQPWKEHPQGVPCLRGQHAPEIIYSKDRLKKPLKRKGPKGTLDFKEISWDQALDEIAQTILSLKEKHGPQCIASFLGRGNFEQSMWRMFTPVVKGFSVPNGIFMPLGSPNTFSTASICYISHGLMAPVTTFGLPGGMLYPDLEHADVIFLWGTNPETDSPLTNHIRVKKAVERGAKLIVIDPMQTDWASNADHWIPIQPGTDGALILGILRQCLKNDGLDKEFITQYCQGYEDFTAYIESFELDYVKNITGVPTETIRMLSTLFSSPARMALLTHSGLEFSNSGVQAFRALYTLWALTENIDVEGGMLFRRPSPVPFRKPDVTFPTNVPPIGMDRYPFFCDLTKNGHFMEFPRSVLNEDPYKIRFLLIGGASILTNFPNTAIFAKALNALDYQVSVDLFLNADAKYADMVLPAATNYEIASVSSYPNESPFPLAVQYRRKMIEPLGEAMNNYLIYSKLADRLGYGHLYPKTEEEMLKLVVKDLPFDFETFKASAQDGPLHLDHPMLQIEKEKKWEEGLLREDGQPGFPTPSGKWEIHSSILENLGHDPLPVYIPVTEGPNAKVLLKQFPLTLNTGARIPSKFRSQHLNIPGLVNMQPVAEVLLHPDDAESRHIATGDAVWVRTPRGKVKFSAHVTSRIKTAVVEVNEGGGAPHQAPGWKDSNVNFLTDEANRDDISGFPVLKALLCEVEKVD